MAKKRTLRQVQAFWGLSQAAEPRRLCLCEDCGAEFEEASPPFGTYQAVCPRCGGKNIDIYDTRTHTKSVSLRKDEL